MRRALVVAAHPDDEVLGCGGTMARLAESGTEVYALILADGESSRDIGQTDTIARRIGLRRDAAMSSAGILGATDVEIDQLPDNRLDTVPLLSVVKRIEESIERLRPERVFAHAYSDVNVDHRRVHEAVLSACRPQPGHPVKELLFYEVPSSTEWRPAGSANQFVPGVYFDITDTLPKKLAALAAYEEEMRPFPHPRSVQAIEALARWRGATVGVRAAEAFSVGRILR